MLLLSRKPGESIRIGDSITVVLLEVRGDKARLGITAPRDVKIYREELLARMRDRAAELPASTAVRSRSSRHGLRHRTRRAAMRPCERHARREARQLAARRA